MSEWLEHTVQVEVAVPIDRVWQLWSDLELMPSWMKWIDSVKIMEDNPELSRWKLASGSLEFTWLSKIVKTTEHQLIQWESVDGLPNRGAIRFYDRENSSIVKLTIGYGVPGFLALIMQNDFIRKTVESTLQADMDRFREFALRDAQPVTRG
jgi:uncharacterized membrane protein